MPSSSARSPSSRVLIAGAGIGGLTLAHAFRTRGIHAEIAEQATHFRPIGAGISLSPNAMGVFERLGLCEALDSKGQVRRSPTDVPRRRTMPSQSKALTAHR